MGPNQGMANQPSMQPTPTQPVQSPEPPVQPVQGGSDIVFQDKPKKKTGMVLGMILLLLIAAGGVGFGVWAYLDGNAQKESLNKQISSLTTQNSDLQTQIDELLEQQSKDEVVVEDSISNELNDSMALSLLQNAAVDGNYEYAINSATVYAKYNGDDKVAYWVKYVEVGEDLSESDLNIIFVEDENGEWTFELPGFSSYTDELVSQYTVL